ncbi:ABC transporter substrate-binding protein [Halobacteriaceae archaeon GCM10025711]
MLQGLGAAGAVGLAGCTDNSGQDTTTTTESDGGGANQDTETTQEQQMGGGKLKLAQVKGPIEFDPIVLNDVPSLQVTDRVVEGLYRYNETASEVIPNIAAEMPTIENDGTRYIVPLNENATFQNGDPVTAEDVKYSFEAPVKEETENASELNMIDSVSVIDDQTVQFDLKYPYGPFMQALTWYVVPKSVREEDKEGFNTNPVGSGPFEFDSWSEGQYARVTRWDDYWGEPLPKLKEIEFVPVVEATTRVTTLQTGENDVIEEIPPKLWEQVKGMGNASIEDTPGVGYFYLAFNTKAGPTSDPKVREAIDYTFSMDQAVSNFVEPTGIRQYSPLPASVAEGWNMPVDEWKQIPHDKNVDKAKSMLDDSDAVPNDWKAKIIVPPDEKREQIGITVQNGLKEAGYDASVQRLDWGAFLDKYVTGDPNDYNMYTLGWSGSPDPDAFTYYFFAEESHGVTDGTYYSKVSDKIVQARESSDHDKRKQLYEEAITTLLEDRAHIPAYNLKNSFGVREYVEDFNAYPVGSGFTIATPWNNVNVTK